MKALISLCAIALIGASSAGCKTAAKQGSSFSSLGMIGNIGSCKKTKNKIVDAYFNKELRRLALKGHLYLFGEAMSGNTAARLVLTAMRLESEAKVTNPNAKVSVEAILGVAEGQQPTEDAVKKFNEAYERNGKVNVRGVGVKGIGLVADSAQLERGTKGTLATLRSSINGATSNQVRREIKEMVAERTKMIDKITVEAVNKTKSPRILAENLRLAEGLSISLAAEINAMNKNMPSNQHMALAEIAANEVAIEGAKASVLGKVAVADALTAKVRNYVNAPESVRRAVTAQTLSLTSNIETATNQARSKKVFEAVARLYPEGGSVQGSIERAGFAELAILEGVLDSATKLGDQNKLEAAKLRVAEVLRAIKSPSAAPKSSTEMKTLMDQMARQFENGRRFRATSDLAYYRTVNRRNMEMNARARILK